MTQLSFWVKGEIVRKGLQDLSAELPKIGRQQLRFMIERVYRRVSPYPPKRPGQKYIRTGDLFSHWILGPSTTVNPGYAIENDMPYAKYVIGDAYGTSQAWMHKGRWLKLRDAMDQEIEKMPAEIEAQINMVARRDGLA